MPEGSPTHHAALAAALAALDKARDAVCAAMGATAPAVPLKRAAHEIGITEVAMRKRAQRGAGFKIGTEWYVSRAYVDTFKRR